MTFILLLYFIFVQISLLVPSYSYLKKLKILEKNPNMQLCIAYVSSLTFFALLATLDYALKLDPLISRILCWAILLLGTLIFFKYKYYKPLARFRFPLFCLLLLNTLSLVFISLGFNSHYNFIPDPAPLPARNYNVFDVKILNLAQTQANDNYIPYRQAQFFINRSNPETDSFISEWGVSFFERTPLMGAVVANYFNLLNDKPPIAYTWSTAGLDPGHTFLKFQIIAEILNGLFILPAIFLIRKLLNAKTAVITSLFMITGQFFVYNSFFSWPKSLVAFFILTSWLFLISGGRKHVLMAGVLSGIAYLTHDLAVIYIGSSLIFLMYKGRFKDILVFIAPVVLLAAPWLLIASVRYHKASSFIYYPFSTKGIPSVSNSKSIFKTFFGTSVFKLIYIRLKSIFYLMTPYQLIFSNGQNIGRRLWALGLFSIPGSLGIGLIIPAYASLLRFCKKFWFVIFIFIPIVLCSLIIGWPDGLGAMHFAEATVVIWSAASIYWLLKLKNPFWLLICYVINCIQFIFFLLYSYNFSISQWFSSVRDLVCCGIIVCILTTVGLLIYKAVYLHKNMMIDSALDIA